MRRLPDFVKPVCRDKSEPCDADAINEIFLKLEHTRPQDEDSRTHAQFKNESVRCKPGKEEVQIDEAKDRKSQNYAMAEPPLRLQFEEPVRLPWQRQSKVIMHGENRWHLIRTQDDWLLA